MAIQQAICTVFKQDLMSPGGNLAAQTLKCALYTNAATLDATTSVYITGNEVSASGTNYTTGGNTLTNVAISVDGTTAIFDADNVTFPNATISAQAALLYNNSNANAAIAVLDFGGVKTSTNGTFELQFPTANASAGLIRIA
jgi:O-acetylhomoserine/O-acetylserine sulfhydrylase-like pyridoxal-dependent enzyme